uniref:Uncharacterized protein n=1 Tax=Arundo donax TaxID=35708 RepID=A0A0A9A612_ARUDO
MDTGCVASPPPAPPRHRTAHLILLPSLSFWGNSL